MICGTVNTLNIEPIKLTVLFEIKCFIFINVYNKILKKLKKLFKYIYITIVFEKLLKLSFLKLQQVIMYFDALLFHFLKTNK